MAVGLPPQAGGSILAATIAAIAPLAVIKPSDESVTSSTTLQNDNALSAALEVASATYLFDCYLDYEGGTLGSSDLKFQWTVPSGASLRFWMANLTTGGVNNASDTQLDSTPYSIGTNGAGALRGVQMKGTLIMSTTTGTLQLQWAQNTSSSTPTIVHAQSYLALWRIS